MHTDDKFFDGYKRFEKPRRFPEPVDEYDFYKTGVCAYPNCSCTVSSMCQSAIDEQNRIVENEYKGFPVEETYRCSNPECAFCNDQPYGDDDALEQESDYLWKMYDGFCWSIEKDLDCLYTIHVRDRETNDMVIVSNKTTDGELISLRTMLNSIEI